MGKWTIYLFGDLPIKIVIIYRYVDPIIIQYIPELYI